MVVQEAAFAACGRSDGIEIFRIENFVPTPVDKKFYGQFFSGDSYIVLRTRKCENSFQWDIHFWLGKDTSQDEKGTAAIKTVELDDMLGGTPVQHREVQEHESAQFMAYFKQGIRYQEGGVASGFKHVEEEVVNRLFKVKGAKNVRVSEVKCECASLNKGDVFILDKGDRIFQWVGPEANRMEKFKAGIAARRIKDEERGGKAKFRIIEAAWDSDEEFFEALGGKTEIAPAEVGGGDKQYERRAAEEVTLYKVSDASGALKVVKVGAKPFVRANLDTNDCFILDSGNENDGIFCWIGKNAAPAERKGAVANANKFVEQQNYPDWTPVTRLVEKGETPIFKSYFRNWKDDGVTAGMGIPFIQNRIAQIEDVPFDASLLHDRHAGNAPSFLPDDGTGEVKVQRINNFKLEDVSNEGLFFGGDSYVVSYTTKKNKSLIYYWLGNQSSTDEKGSAAALSAEMDQKQGGTATIIRVVQGKEPEHFLRIFKGKMIVLLGGTASGFKSLQDKQHFNKEGNRLFHVKGTNDYNTRAVEMLSECKSLNSADVFVLETATKFTVWIGKSASPCEKQFGLNIASQLNSKKSVETVEEGSESAEFWKAVGGKGAYAKVQEEEDRAYYPSRLFHCSNATGRFIADEIMDFAQEDLVPQDVMVLDAYDQVFIWVGSECNDAEKKLSQKLAEDYVSADKTGRTLDSTTFVTVKQGSELPFFTCHFHGWTDDFWKAVDSWDMLKNRLEA